MQFPRRKHRQLKSGLSGQFFCLTTETLDRATLSNNEVCVCVFIEKYHKHILLNKNNFIYLFISSEQATSMSY